MKNKRLAIFLTIFVFLAVIVVLSSAVFALKDISVNFLSTTDILTGTEQNIIDSGNFKVGENVFFATKSAYIKNIEKDNPYIRVINIETIFPNKFVINAVERNETYVIKLDNNKYAKTDEYLKVLEVTEKYQNSTSNGIEVKNSGLSGQSVSAGDFFETNDFLSKLFYAFKEWDSSVVSIKNKIASVELNYEQTDKLLINMRSGVQIIIRKSSNQLSDKLNLAFSFYDTKTDKDGNAVDYTKSGIIDIIETDKIYGSYRTA